MNITLTVNGRLHTFDVARQLDAKGHLRRLITSYPKFSPRKWGISSDKIVSLPAIEVLKRAAIKAGMPGELLCAPFDLCTAQLVPDDSDVVESWSGSSLHTIRRAKKLGIPSVLKRSSAHIQTQNELLLEEHARWGGAAEPIPTFIIRRELAEYQEADFILASSSFIARTLRERGVPASKVLCLPLGVDVAQFRPMPQPHDAFRVVFAGAASLRKGVQYLLQAMAGLDTSRIELWLVGSVAPEIRKLVDELGSGWVHLKGHFPQQELPKVYGQCDALCLPSIEEGFGTVVAQAMACELPVIVSENVGAADLVDETCGRVVKVRDVLGLRAAIGELLDDPERARQMGRAARARLQDGHSWSDYADRLVELYGTLKYRDRLAAAEP
jgi:glycosyltransferase involved in cell wall biosynthesis